MGQYIADPNDVFRRFRYKIWPQNYFFKRRASYHFKTWECKNVRAFEFLNWRN